MAAEGRARMVVCSCGRRNRVPAAAHATPRCRECRDPLPWVVDASDGEFGEVADSASLPVVVDLWAPICPHGLRVVRVVEQVADDLAGQVKVVTVNVQDAPQLARRFSVQGSPTLLIMHRGTLVARRCGPAPAYEIRAWIDHALDTA